MVNAEDQTESARNGLRWRLIQLHERDMDFLRRDRAAAVRISAAKRTSDDDRETALRRIDLIDAEVARRQSIATIGDPIAACIQVGHYGPHAAAADCLVMDSAGRCVNPKETEDA